MSGGPDEYDIDIKEAVEGLGSLHADLLYQQSEYGFDSDGFLLQLRAVGRILEHFQRNPPGNSSVKTHPVEPPLCYGMTAADFSTEDLLIPVDWNIVAWLRRRGFRIERFGTVQHPGEWIAYPWAETITQAVPELVGHTRLIVVEIEKPVA